MKDCTLIALFEVQLNRKLKRKLGYKLMPGMPDGLDS